MRIPFTLLGLTLLLSLPAAAASDVTCVDLQCEFLTNPVGVDRDQPRLSWRIESKTRGQKFIAHRIVCASSAEILAANQGDLWDSGREDEIILLYRRYGSQHRTGKPLAAGQEVHWKVMVWDVNDEATEWSAPAKFTMALTDEREWQAEWISFKDSTPLPRVPTELHLPPPHYYRKEFQTGKNVKRALVYATALGIYDLHLNGAKVGDALFAPGWTDYRQRVYFNTYEVTSQIVEGPNCLGAVVADGWYAGYVGFGLLRGYGPNNTGRNIYGKTPALSVQLHLEYEDGSTETIVTDPTWQVGTGPESEADLLMGETYDATKANSGWDKAGFAADGWEPAVPATANGNVKAPFIDKQGRRSEDVGFIPPALMDAYPAPPVRVTQELPARAVTEAKPGTWIFDFGQNFAGNVRLQVKGEKGQKLTLRYGEMLHPDGTLLTENLRMARATDTYLCNGDPKGESWTPRFTYHGFRYAEITGLKEKPAPETLTGLVIHNDLKFTSGFECSDSLVNKIYQNSFWTQRSNFVELPTNCPQRDERLGWTGDGQMSMSTGCYHMDARAFYEKWINEMQEARTIEGYYPAYAPLPFADSRPPYGTAWSDAGLIAPYILWRMYGERQVVQDRWFAIEKYVKARFNADKELSGEKFGTSWGDPNHLEDPTPDEFLNLCYLALDARLMMDVAEITSGPIANTTYTAVLVKILENFQKRYIDPEGHLTVKSQTAHALALRFGLVPPEHQAQVAKDLIDLLQTARSDERSGLRTGLLGTRALLTVLSQNGHGDEAVRLLQSRKYPSWGFEVANGATTMWERWDAYSEKFGFSGVNGLNTAATNSFSHLVNGEVGDWMMSSLAGIAAGTPGFRSILLNPTIPTAATADAVEGVDPITWVRAHYDSARGRIAVHWKKNEDGSLLYEVTIPPHTDALLKLPLTLKEGASVFEGGKPLSEASPKEVVLVEGHQIEGMALILIDSGSYRFEVK